MMSIIVLMLFFILTGCTSEIAIEGETLSHFQTQLVSITGVEDIDVHYIRPRLIWQVGVLDESRNQFVFDEIISFMNDDDWLMSLKERYYIIDIKIEIVDVNGIGIVEYRSDYYVPGTTIYADEKNNEIDGFKTWYSSDGSEFVLDEGF